MDVRLLNASQILARVRSKALPKSLSTHSSSSSSFLYTTTQTLTYTQAHKNTTNQKPPPNGPKVFLTLFIIITKIS